MDSDASYGYLKLQDYKCYTGWTGEGSGLPADMLVFRGVASTCETFEQIVEGYYNSGNYASDGNTGTASTLNWFSGNYAYPLTGLFTQLRKCVGVRWWVSDANITTGNPDNKINMVKIQTTADGTNWTTRVESWDAAWFGDWGQYNFGSTVSIKGMRIYVRSTAANGTSTVKINEIQILTEYENETSLFVQGQMKQP
jgi:hypothetical protein